MNTSTGRRVRPAGRGQPTGSLPRIGGADAGGGGGASRVGSAGRSGAHAGGSGAPQSLPALRRGSSDEGATGAPVVDEEDALDYLTGGPRGACWCA
jgi:hypothetical protein